MYHKTIHIFFCYIKNKYIKYYLYICFFQFLLLYLVFGTIFIINFFLFIN